MEQRYNVMKKIVALILAVAMAVMSLVVFASCGKKDDNVLVCGVTLFDRINYKDENGEWVGFDSDFAKEVGKILGMEVKFQEIQWEQKYSELSSGAIDCIWNGFTANSSDNGTPRKELVDFSYGYMLNQQCVVVKKSNLESFKSEADLAGKTAVVEAGSAGQSYADSIVGDDGKVIKAAAQINAFTEVKSGAADFAVVDIILAQNVCGQGNFDDLCIVDAIELESEIYAIGFARGSELTAKVNAAIITLRDNGTLLEIAKRYGLENSLLVQETVNY